MVRTPITHATAIPLRASAGRAEDLDSSRETILVLVHDENGEVGIGESQAPAKIVRELIVMEDQHGWSRGLSNILVGRDPFELGALHDELYRGTIYHGRRGLGIHALSAVDIALHDLVGKQLGRPVYQLLASKRR
jgi:L-rhamnonate dehydratase